MTDGWAKIRVAGNLRLQHRVADLENLLAQHGIDHHKHEGCERTMENPISETLRRKTAELEAIYRAYPDLQPAVYPHPDPRSWVGSAPVAVRIENARETARPVPNVT